MSDNKMLNRDYMGNRSEANGSLPEGKGTKMTGAQTVLQPSIHINSLDEAVDAIKNLQQRIITLRQANTDRLDWHSRRLDRIDNTPLRCSKLEDRVKHLEQCDTTARERREGFDIRISELEKQLSEVSEASIQKYHKERLDARPRMVLLQECVSAISDMVWDGENGWAEPKGLDTLKKAISNKFDKIKRLETIIEMYRRTIGDGAWKELEGDEEYLVPTPVAAEEE